MASPVCYRTAARCLAGHSAGHAGPAPKAVPSEWRPDPIRPAPESGAPAGGRHAERATQEIDYGRRGKGYTAGIAFDTDVPMGKSPCVSCGECLISCPTGALTLKSEAAVVAGLDPGTKLAGEALTTEDLRRIPILRGVSGNFLDLNRGSVVKRTFQQGEVICREGEFGSTAFYILQGKVDIFLSTPMAHSSSHAVGKGGGWRAVPS